MESGAAEKRRKLPGKAKTAIVTALLPALFG